MLDNYNNLLRRLIIRDKINGKESYSLYLTLSKIVLVYHAYYYLYKTAYEKKIKTSNKTIEFLKDAHEKQ